MSYNFTFGLFIDRYMSALSLSLKLNFKASPPLYYTHIMYQQAWASQADSFKYLRAMQCMFPVSVKYNLAK